MNKMVEQVARAIQNQQLSNDSIKLAHAAIEAMRKQFQDHYWDSLENQKHIIMLHINKMCNEK